MEEFNPRNLNGSDIEFEQDLRIKFDEEFHRYFLDNDEMTPVSCVISKFFKEFDAMFWSMKKCNNDEFKAEQLREKWEANASLKSQAGTFMHKQIENYLNGIDPEFDCQVCFDGKFIHANETVDISREWKYFKDWENNTQFTPFRTEWRVYDLDSHMAGTIDLVCACDDGSYEIYDWKRSNKINPDEFNRWSSGLNGLEHLTDTSYIHYCLQQNLYRYMLEKNYSLKIKHMNLVVLHPELSGYRVVPIPRMDKEVSIIVNSRR